MFNNINDNPGFLYNSQLDNSTNVVNLALLRSKMQKSNWDSEKNPYVDKTEISANAIELFERDCDINKFNKVAMSCPEDFSHLTRMQEIFDEGVVDVFEDEVLSKLVTNSKLWDDLEL